jgi:hypothetical protein
MIRSSVSRTRGLFVATALAVIVGGLSAKPLPPRQALEFSVEGPLQAVNVAAGTITVMGITINVAGATFSSPTKVITLADLAGPALLGRATPGFINGTAIVDGTVVGTSIVATSVFAEPAENGIVGVVTRNNPGGPLNGRDIAINGLTLVPIIDARFDLVLTNDVGLPIDVGTVPVGTLAAAEGFFGLDGVLHVHTFEGEGQTVGPVAQTSVTRVRCDGRRVEMQGGSTTAPGTVQFFNPANNALLGTAAVTLDPLTGQGAWRIRFNVNGCPANVRVVNSNGSQITVPVL